MRGGIPAVSFYSVLEGEDFWLIVEDYAACWIPWLSIHWRLSSRMCENKTKKI